MATTLPKASASRSTKPGSAPGRQRSNGSNALGKLLLFVILIGLLSAAVWGSGQYFTRVSSSALDSALTLTVGRGELLITVTEDGSLESASNLDIKCQVAGGSSILWIVPDGSEVKAGDRLVELDASALDESINQQRIVYEKARSTKIQAEKTFEVAKLAVREYLEGTYKKEMQDADALITISMENLRSAQNSLEHGERMFRKGYVSNLELEGQRFAVERAQLELDSARTARDVLVNFSRAKMLQDLESQRDTAEATMKSELAAFDLEELRLKRLEGQLAQCTITAPTDGMVVYANEQMGRGGQQQSGIEEGAAVRERQTILKLPDLSQDAGQGECPRVEGRAVAARHAGSHPHSGSRKNRLGDHGRQSARTDRLVFGQRQGICHSGTRRWGTRKPAPRNDRGGRDPGGPPQRCRLVAGGRRRGTARQLLLLGSQGR